VSSTAVVFMAVVAFGFGWWGCLGWNWLRLWRASSAHRRANHIEFARDFAAGRHQPAVAIDFDGVIHAFVSRFTRGVDIPDEPVPGALDFIRAVDAAGYKVIIHTARANDTAAVVAIRTWLTKHGLEAPLIEKLKITSHKTSADVYIDDRGWRFEGVFPTVEAIRALRQWNKPS
jgi:hypothetical protein